MARPHQDSNQHDAESASRLAIPESPIAITAENNEVFSVARPATRWRPRNWRLRTKLVVVLLIPTVIALVLAGIQVTGDIAQAGQLSILAKQAEVQSNIANVVHELQRERDLTVRYVISTAPGDQLSVIDKQRGLVSAAINALRDQLDQESPLAESLRQSYRAVLPTLAALDALRRDLPTGANARNSVEAAYTESITALLGLSELISASSDRPALVRLEQSIVAIGRAKEQLSRERAILLSAFQQKRFDQQQQRALFAAEAEYNAANKDFHKSATDEQRRYADRTLVGPDLATAEEMRNAAESGAVNQSPDRWEQAATGTINLTRQIERNLIDQFVSDTAGSAADMRTLATNRAILVLAALVIAVFLAMLVAYSLLKPLRVLRDTALAVADRKLPEAVERILVAPDPIAAASTAIEPVPVRSTEELGQVARSFDAVYGEAVRLAAEQAVLRDNVNAMFVNLSRRSQALVERQLSLIDQLEQDEQDPDQLANLFELDHLATRMRRNSENLLILAGAELGKRLTKPVPVSDVVGAAVSEVERYARVQVAELPEAALLGRAVNDVVHLLAELLDNATAFSEPDTKVLIRKAYSRQGELGIEIVDRGVGLSDQEIATYNARLADPPEVDVAISRRMGLFVVGRLASRHDIKVRLHRNTDRQGGTTVLVVLPAELIRPMEVAPIADRPTTAVDRKLLSSAGQPQNTGQTPSARDYQPQEPAKPTYDIDAPTDRLPVYAAVLSQWFHPFDNADASGNMAPPTTPDETVRRTQPTGAEQHRPEWTSPADSGWQAAETAFDHPQEFSSTTAGLPKRVPRAQLVPGAAGSLDAPTPTPHLARSAEQVRGQMANFQQGLRRGRHAKVDIFTRDSSNGGSQRAESSGSTENDKGLS